MKLASLKEFTSLVCFYADTSDRNLQFMLNTQIRAIRIIRAIRDKYFFLIENVTELGVPRIRHS